MSSKIPVLPPDKIIKVLKNLYLKNVRREAAMPNMLIIKLERYLLFQCIVKLQKVH